MYYSIQGDYHIRTHHFSHLFVSIPVFFWWRTTCLMYGENSSDNNKLRNLARENIQSWLRPWELSKQQANATAASTKAANADQQSV
jgi:hypothetical protein